MTTAEEIKSCCAAAYSSDVVTLLLGDSYHPGGLALTRRLAGHLDLAADARTLDVACGRGATALLLAREHRVRVDGIDLSTANVALAQGTAAAAGLADRVAFTVADAEHLPYPDRLFDAVVCECALCTFPDKPTATARTRPRPAARRPGRHHRRGCRPWQAAGRADRHRRMDRLCRRRRRPRPC